MQCERHNRLHPTAPRRTPYLQRALADARGVFVAVSDYMKALPLTIASWLPGPLTALGTDGFGLSETRAALREHFEISAEHIVAAALATLDVEPRSRP